MDPRLTCIAGDAEYGKTNEGIEIGQMDYSSDLSETRSTALKFLSSCRGYWLEGDIASSGGKHE